MRSGRLVLLSDVISSDESRTLREGSKQAIKLLGRFMEELTKEWEVLRNMLLWMRSYAGVCLTVWNRRKLLPLELRSLRLLW